MMDWMTANQTPPASTVLLDYILRGNEANLVRFCAFATERMNIFWRRQAGEDRRYWTNDPVLKQYKFTNCYRILDRVSQYLIGNISNTGEYKRTTGEHARLYIRFGRTYLFKMFNSIDTWEAMPERLLSPINYGEPSMQWLYSAIKVWAEERQAWTPIFGNAYLMAPPDGKIYRTRVELYLATMCHLYNTTYDETPAWKAIMKSTELSTPYAILREQRGFGDFLAYQFAMDFAYGCEQEVNFNSFVVPGPGCRRGMEKVFGEQPAADLPAILKAMYVHQAALFKVCKADFKWLRHAGSTWYLQVSDFQNLFCEFDKYSRVAYPELSSKKARHSIKNTFAPTGDLGTYHVPRNWLEDLC